MQPRRTVGAVGLATSLVPVLAGLVASAVLLVDYSRPKPVFCSEGGGCDALRHTVYGHPLGIPMPAFGLAGFLVLGVCSLLPGVRARTAQVALGAVAALAGTALLVLQAVLGHFCPWCALADASGILSVFAAAGRLLLAADGGTSLLSAALGATSLVAAAAVPFALGLRRTPVPQVIRDEMARTPKGQVTVVDFVDFECPFCRMTQADLAPLLAEHAGKVRLVRRQVPLRIHPHALDAARAACCGRQLGKGEAMADALFAAPVEDLTPEGCEKIAASLGLPADAFRACVRSPAADALIEADKTEFQAAGGYALPTIWIDGTELVGSQPPGVLSSTLDAALSHADAGS